MSIIHCLPRMHSPSCARVMATLTWFGSVMNPSLFLARHYLVCSFLCQTRSRNEQWRWSHTATRFLQFTLKGLHLQCHSLITETKGKNNESWTHMFHIIPLNNNNNFILYSAFKASFTKGAYTEKRKTIKTKINTHDKIIKSKLSMIQISEETEHKFMQNWI